MKDFNGLICILRTFVMMNFLERGGGRRVHINGQLDIWVYIITHMILKGEL